MFRASKSPDLAEDLPIFFLMMENLPICFEMKTSRFIKKATHLYVTMLKEQ